MERKLPQVERQNDKGACWTCLKRKRECDQSLPCCRTCARLGVKCRGYAVRLHWPAGLSGSPRPPARPSRRRSGAQATPSRGSREGRPSQAHDSTDESLVECPRPASASPLPAEDSFFIQHFLHNFARVALAIDYEDNGYRFLLPMAMQEQGLMSAILAVAASHYSRWQKTPDTQSRRYRRAALQALQNRFQQPALIRCPTTLACMLALVTYEVFSGSSRWRGHHDAIRGWVRFRRDCSDLDPFLKTWVCLIDTQCALNTGSQAMPELGQWMDERQKQALAGQEDSIDALFGCSSRLPKLMFEASQLYSSCKARQIPAESVRAKARALQQQILATRMAPDADPSVMILCQQTGHTLAVTVDMEKNELRRRMIATAEIFRHACQIYVYRLTHDPGEHLSAAMHASLQTALELLTWVPDAVGPGANLGWCLVILGAELDRHDQRDYIRSRWHCLDLLGIDNYKNAQRILEEVWNQRDRVRQGHAAAERWQDVMQHFGQTQILV